MDLMYEKHLRLSPKDAGTISAVLMVFAIGTQYAHLESAGQKDRDNDARDDEISARFYRHATKLLPDVIHLGSLESVQACLLFGLYALPLDASGLAYVYLNLALKIAMQNGMHRKLSGNNFSATVIETRNRVWWTVYCLEKCETPLTLFDISDFPAERSAFTTVDHFPSCLQTSMRICHVIEMTCRRRTFHLPPHIC
jgi:hypothetical protein